MALRNKYTLYYQEQTHVREVVIEHNTNTNLNINTIGLCSKGHKLKTRQFLLGVDCGADSSFDDTLTVTLQLGVSVDHRTFKINAIKPTKSPLTISNHG